MSKKPETIFKDKVRAFLESLPNTFFIKIQQLALVGDPDFVICINGRFVGMELKASEGARIAKLQQYKLDRINQAGGLGIVAYPENWQTISQTLKKMSDLKTVAQLKDCV